MRLGVLAVALVLVLPAAAGTAQFARIQYVIDGDTVVLANGEHVRLVQIDAPEVEERECYGVAARTLLRGLAPPGTTVRVEADPRLDQVDRYGRLLRYLFRGPVNLNLELVRRGAATVWFYRHDRGRYAGALLRTAQAARAAGRGLWGACPGTPFDPYHAAHTGTP
jgi:micrococcal nuclease